MHPAPRGVEDRTRKKFYWRTVPDQHCILAEGDIGAPLLLAHRSTLHAHTAGVRKGETFRFFNIMYSFTLPIGGPNISVRLVYVHPNRLLTGLYKQEMEIR
jgi:hypothetical protein